MQRMQIGAIDSLRVRQKTGTIQNKRLRPEIVPPESSNMRNKDTIIRLGNRSVDGDPICSVYCTNIATKTVRDTMICMGVQFGRRLIIKISKEAMYSELTPKMN